MNVAVKKSGIISTNTYFAVNNGEAVIVDPEGSADEILDVLAERRLEPVAILLTHGHFDHIGAVADLKARGIPVYGHPADKAQMMSRRAKPFTLDVEVADGMELDLIGLAFKVLHTPGHSKGSVCYVVEDKIFSGDTLFYHDRGRTDLPGGDEIELHDSLIKLFRLDGEYKVFPGHDRSTTLEEERRYFGYVPD